MLFKTELSVIESPVKLAGWHNNNGDLSTKEFNACNT